MWDVDVDLEGGFPLALAWFRAHAPMTEEAFGNLSARAREKGDKVAGVAQLDLAADVWEGLDKALEAGADLKVFIAEVGDQLAQAWGGDDPKRLETIFRTNVQTAYGAGRVLMQDDPVIKEARPYKRFVAVLDDRTSEICEELNETTLPSDDPFWEDHEPPLHFNCRSTVITLDEEQAQEFGVDSSAPDVAAQEGFGDPLARWEPSLEDKPEPLAAQYRAKPQPEVAPPPRAEPEPLPVEPTPEVPPPARWDTPVQKSFDLPVPPGPMEGPKEFDPNVPDAPAPKPKRVRKPRAPKAPAEPVVPTSAETPAQAAAAAALTKGTVVKTKALGGGMMETILVDLKQEGFGELRGVFKPRAGERQARDNVREGTYSFREEAASRVAQEIGYKNVPVTRRREVKGRAGSIQHFQEGAQPTGRYAETWDRVSKLDGEKFRAFDYLIGNTDRHTGNILWDEKGQPILIDHGLTLPYKTEGTFNQNPGIIEGVGAGRGSQHVGPFSAEAVAWIKAIDVERVARAMKVSGVDSDAVELSLRRIEHLKLDQSFITGFSTERSGRQVVVDPYYNGRQSLSAKAMKVADQGLPKEVIDRLRATVVKVFSEPKMASEP